MPQLTVDVKAVKNNRTETIELLIQQVKNNQRQDAIFTTQKSSEIQNITDVANWILSQQSPQTEPEHGINKRLIIQFHTEQPSPEVKVENLNANRILDSVESVPLPEIQAKNQFNQLPVFSNGLPGINSYIDENVTNLATAKQAIAEIAKACFYLQIQLNNGGN